MNDVFTRPGLMEVVDADITVTPEYRSPALDTNEQASLTVLRKEPPRQKVLLGYSFKHLESALEDLLGLCSLIEGSPSQQMLIDACQFLTTFSSETTPPIVLRNSDGGFQFEWYDNGFSVEVEFDPDGDYGVFVDDAGDIDTREPQDGDFREFVERALGHFRRD